MQRLKDTFGLTELSEMRHGADAPETYARGKDWIGVGLGSDRFCNALARYGMPSYNDGVFSNHRGLYWDFSVNTLFGGIDDDLTSPSSHRLRLNSPRTVQSYLKTLDAQLTRHKVYTKLAQLE